MTLVNGSLANVQKASLVKLAALSKSLSNVCSY